MKEKNEMLEKRIFLTMEKVYSRNILDFRYKFASSRLWRDGEILSLIYKEFGISNTKATLSEKLNEYINSWEFLKNASLKELEEKGWITDELRKFTLKIIDCYENNYLDLNK